MPAPVAPEKYNPQLLTVLFWIGVAIAPIAALILLIADGNGPLRFAAVLAIMAVVLIGLSIALRADGGQPRGEEFLDELEQLRRELRAEIVAAAQRGNQALDQSQRVEDQVAALRRRLDTAAAGIAAAVGITGAVAEEPAGAGRARVPAPEAHDRPSGGRRRAAAPEEAPASWGRAATDRDDEEPAGRRYGGERPAAGQAGVYGGAREARGAAAAAEPSGRPVVRHTETVHVTTRHTVVDGADPAVGNAYGGYGGRWSPAAEESSWGGAEAENSWSERAEPERGWPGQRDERAGGQREERSWSGGQREERPWSGGQPEERSWPGAGDDRADQSWAGGSYPAEEGWSGVRAGDRWAEVRDDGRGREVRVGERRAELHADGAEFRVQDRWASVRHDEPRRSAEQWGGGGWVEPEEHPALPAGGVPVPHEWRGPARGQQPAEQSWGDRPAEQWRPPAQREPADSWRSAEPEPRARRQWDGEQRYGHPPQDDSPRAGGRWR
ncbi:hypothetical protein ACSNN7_13645 [Micromonospora sp. URMC 105]|uniref:hypothetical protein n=1 Tax=Micromonospora sp. URMC 105 TaxID=3423413 RepID=UPI003F1B2C24